MIKISITGKTGEGSGQVLIKVVNMLLQSERDSIVLIFDEYGEFGPDLEFLNPSSMTSFEDLEDSIIHQITNRTRLIHLIACGLPQRKRQTVKIDIKNIVESINCREKVYLIEKNLFIEN